jgi:DNA-binding LytR/AlgR family response regulator
MKVLIVEDEAYAVKHLERLLSEWGDDIEVVAVLDSVRSTCAWFRENRPPDLAFFDIELADDRSFSVFEQVEVKCPIIFTTAYDQYAIDAFKVNSVDYLLKPIKKEDLFRGLRKYHERTSLVPSYEDLRVYIEKSRKKYKERFVIRVGEHLKAIPVSEVSVLFSEEKTTYLQTTDGLKLILDFSLDQLTEVLDPAKFFRINRKYIVSIDSIGDIITFSNSRLKLHLKEFHAQDLIVSREKVSLFKEWLDH